MAQNKPLGPFRLVTVNTAPERAKKIVGRVVEDVRETYTIVHAGNAEGEQPCLLSQIVPISSAPPGELRLRGFFFITVAAIDSVERVVEDLQPDVLVRLILHKELGHTQSHRDVFGFSITCVCAD